MKTNKQNDHLTRREFLKLSATSLGALLIVPPQRTKLMPDFPSGERLGRVVAGALSLHARPTPDSAKIRTAYEDEILVIERTVLGSQPFRQNQTWQETPEGYVWSPDIQPVLNLPNDPLVDLPQTSLGAGVWAEVTVPYVDLAIANPPARAPWLRNRLESGLSPRFFYSQIVWVDQIEVDAEGQVWYGLNERFGYGDLFWAPAEAFRLLTPEEVTPISPEVENKYIRVDVSRQTISAFEGNNEVYFARASTGVMFNAAGERVDEWGTPVGQHRIWRKSISLPLAGGSAAAGWDLPAVGWISLFVGSGVAFHSTYWHNNYGVPTSRGCVNLSPDDAKWVFRWTQPQVAFDPGDVTVGMPGGTMVEVFET
ncbi:MAG: L,D-transpeptidase [Chloroflexi bacterium]|nr:MAG: L,D-transpeptidase [Chloroflexota bacterium]MBL1194959.1 L,D-transpeptidase [Chloroflexota bacterium]NOH12249.1 L,D-transpeptidase [Chloroflexota bacterium]